MKVCTCFLLFGIFAYTNSTARVKPKNDDIGVNPAFANGFEISNVDYSGDTENLDNVDKFITKETTAIDKNKNMKPVTKPTRLETLKYFIQEAVNILNTYEDTTFKVFFRILDNEIRKYHYKDCKFSELMQNHDTRSWLAETLKIIRGKSVYFMKANINKLADMISDKTYGNDVTELLDYINSLYRHSEQNVLRGLKELKHFKNTKSIRTQKKIIKSVVQNILFNYYTELDNNTRRQLKDRIETFWNRFNNNHASSATVSNNHKMNGSESVSDIIKVSQNLINKVKELESDSKKYLKRNLINKSERSVSIHDGDTKRNISDSRHYTESVLTVKSKLKPRTRRDDDKKPQNGKSGKSKTKSKHAKAHIFAEYNAVIDVQLANTELLKSIGVFKPVTDKE